MVTQQEFTLGRRVLGKVEHRTKTVNLGRQIKVSQCQIDSSLQHFTKRQMVMSTFRANAPRQELARKGERGCWCDRMQSRMLLKRRLSFSVNTLFPLCTTTGTRVENSTITDQVCFCSSSANRSTQKRQSFRRLHSNLSLNTCRRVYVILSLFFHILLCFFFIFVPLFRLALGFLLVFQMSLEKTRAILVKTSELKTWSSAGTKREVRSQTIAQHEPRKSFQKAEL